MIHTHSHRSHALQTAILVLALALPRMLRLGTDWQVPDATFAAMFLAGTLRLGWGNLAVCLLTIVGFDLFALLSGVGTSCINASYPLRIAVFTGLFQLGRLAAQHPWSRKLGLLLLGSVAAYALKSGGFYLLSGRFDPSLSGFFARMASQYPDTLRDTLLYWLPASFALSSRLRLWSARLS